MTVEQPPPIMPHKPVKRADLTPGRLIYRWTDETAAGVFAPLPCHEEQAVKLEPSQSAVVICRVCSESYMVDLERDCDGSYTAAFIVTYVPHLLSRARR
jgi:hypothetical protein